MTIEQTAEPQTAEQQLAAAREAWRTRNWCEREISRLKRYQRMTPAMKTDYYSHAAALREAESVLTRVLSGAR
ncbi:MAG TPA: hypothetical protein VFE72_04245 [Lysobacter sp.]|nr:hypothetical protein [Lysobacter sp.]